jgi:transcriptional repressor NrdR
MLCPYCKKPTTNVLDKRDSDNIAVTRRRRECQNCKKRFTTYERVENIELEVVKKSGSREQFDRNKLKNGISRAIKKRMSEKDLENIVEQIEVDLSQRKGNTCTSEDIGNLVLEKLFEKDKLSYLRFISVYKHFETIDDFATEIQKITQIEKIIDTLE